MFAFKYVSWPLITLSILLAFPILADFEIADEESVELWQEQDQRTLGIHFTVPGGQPATTINSSSVTLWCNGACTNPQQQSVTNNGTGFSISPGNFTYVCTRNGSQCFPAGNLQAVCGGTGSIKIVNNYANGHTFTSDCLPVMLTSNTMVMITPADQSMCTTTSARSCT